MAKRRLGMFICKAVTHGDPIELPYYAETQFLIVTPGPCQTYSITHKPTGYAFGQWDTIAQADAAMQKVIDLDWNFGQRWKPSLRTRRRHEQRPKLQAVLAGLRERLPEVFTASF